MTFLFFGLFESTQKPTKTDKDINQSIIHLQKINIGLNQFKFGCYTFTQSSIAVAVAAFLRLILPTRFFYSFSFTCLFLVNNPEIYVILDSFNSQYSLKDKRIPFITLVKDKLNTLKRNKSKSKDTMFRFEIYENQRWWMGLDWTHALLPGERPTWSDSNLDPVLPPNTFNLPQDTSTNDKIVYTWSWLDESWMVTTPGQNKPVKILPLPNIPSEDDDKGDNSTHSFSVDRSGAEKALKQGLAKFNRHSAQAPTETKQKSVDKDPPTRSSIDAIAGSNQEMGTADGVDQNGWSYGDNQWERWSSKNGMGCYTRRRKWIRTAVLKQVLVE
ncbi:hypothetical protein E3P77_00786 [Wallemia ichthyophaga]|uniref:Peroxisomal membrane protein PEX30 n=1 Tax=Wallemia ichthyophaga (strain EXF-994 / CBS 113033) TaxID=1299270 RepID=R9AGA8_WALI9|nr:Peroxisomal membrane protein PEX30 [Wallemia ichthyophaga EXF-994]EOR01170.1 Peroxisomal membrane protein PEX30 [Wallemia ichthyophaga EXF-994]TIB68975.1 hypothetical protein E3P77_00786 [Wallemia ichthyophaga]